MIDYSNVRSKNKVS